LLVLIAIILISTSTPSATAGGTIHQAWRSTVIAGYSIKCIFPHGQAGSIGLAPANLPAGPAILLRNYMAYLRNSKHTSPFNIGSVAKMKAGYWEYYSTATLRTKTNSGSSDSRPLTSGAWARQLAELPAQIALAASAAERQSQPFQVKPSDLDSSSNELLLVPCRN
jgi:hypothetical protein